MKVVHDQAGLAPFHHGVFVPTMGALHAGHAALIHRARELARASRRPVVVSVFVNPTQFNEQSDFDRYPRTLETDAAVCEREGADCVFAPSSEVVYPRGGTVLPPALPAVATEPQLEDSHRPGHFAGVCQVCKRLFELVRPTLSVFGEKDWQQLQVVSTMVASLGMPLKIVGMPTVREPDGLAMSSRNVRLSPDDRKRATAICRALIAAGKEADPAAAERAAIAVLSDAGVTPEYVAVREAASLGALRLGHAGYPPARTLIAARVGTTRLIDNAPWPGFDLGHRS
jgi:pantoate--beta-alanine ligase